jgi:hypothetical protein
MTARRSPARRRGRRSWNPVVAIEPPPHVFAAPAPIARGPVELLGTSCDASGTICGPYEHSYSIESGYPGTDRVIVRP